MKVAPLLRVLFHLIGDLFCYKADVEDECSGPYFLSYFIKKSIVLAADHS